LKPIRVEEVKTRFLFSITFSPKILRLRDNVEKSGRAGHIDDNMAQALCVPDN
jgi:hypothetical protein